MQMSILQEVIKYGIVYIIKVLIELLFRFCSR